MADAQHPSCSAALGHQLLLLSLIQVGCLFFSSPAADQRHQPPPRRRKISPFSHPYTSPSPSSQPRRRLSPSCGGGVGGGSSSPSFRSYLCHLFSSPNALHPKKQQQAAPPAAAPTPIKTLLYPEQEQGPSPQQPPQLRHYLVYPDSASSPCTPPVTPPSGSPAKSRGILESCEAAVLPVKRSSFASRADIFPCASCGEIFSRAHLLDLHRAARHALSELPDGDSGKNIVGIIFQSGWKGRGTMASAMEAIDRPTIYKILKVQHPPVVLSRFEECRDAVRRRAAADGGDERCAVDGNERLRFYCATFLCGLDREGNTGTCDSPFCAACGIIRHGFSGKDAEGVSTHATGWSAHASLPEELEKEFAFMRFRRAMLLCRVVAGRVAPGKAGPAAAMTGQEAAVRGDYDSVVVSAGGGGGGVSAADGEMVVFNARAVLPCFVIVYRRCD